MFYILDNKIFKKIRKMKYLINLDRDRNKDKDIDKEWLNELKRI